MAGTNPASAVDRVALTIDLVSAYLAHNRVPPAELPALIAGVHAGLASLLHPPLRRAVEPRRPSPAQVRHSITPEGLISFEDGASYKLLRRHLRQQGLTPQAYRAKWGLPHDYPMTAPSYSALRSELARRGGLGQKRQAPATAEPAKPSPASDTPRPEVARRGQGQRPS